MVVLKVNRPLGRPRKLYNRVVIDISSFLTRLKRIYRKNFDTWEGRWVRYDYLRNHRNRIPHQELKGPRTFDDLNIFHHTYYSSRNIYFAKWRISSEKVSFIDSAKCLFPRFVTFFSFSKHIAGEPSCLQCSLIKSLVFLVRNFSFHRDTRTCNQEERITEWLTVTFFLRPDSSSSRHDRKKSLSRK